MSSPESSAPLPHPTLGGKSLQSLERPRYKSWRKKYRKMRANFDSVLEENKKMFREEQKLELISKRLREELDGLLDLALDLNSLPSLSPSLRYDISLPLPRYDRTPDLIPKDLSPEDANQLLRDYTNMVNGGNMPPLDFHVMRSRIDTALASQEVVKLGELEESVSHAVPTAGVDVVGRPLIIDGEEQSPPNFLTSEQEDQYLYRLDAKTDSGEAYRLTTQQKDVLAEEKHWAELTPREQERQLELQNPQSQHNWIKAHSKLAGATGGDIDDTESLASHDAPKPARKRGSKNLAKQVGDRAVVRARGEGISPSAASDEEVGEEGGVVVSRKKGKDPDQTYRAKGGKSGSAKGKRKRSGEDVGVAGKKPKVEGAE